jgi:hypothetical protein
MRVSGITVNTAFLGQLDLLAKRTPDALQKKVIPIFHYALKERGFLLVGNTEGLLGSGAEIFDLVDRKSKIYQKKSVPSPVTFGLNLSPHTPGKIAQLKSERALEKEDVPKTPADVQREADRLLLTKYVPSAVVVNHDLEILQTRGRTHRYLELRTGKASLNLLKMARPGLHYELCALIDGVRKNSVPVAKDGVVLDDKQPITLASRNHSFPDSRPRPASFSGAVRRKGQCAAGYASANKSANAAKDCRL